MTNQPDPALCFGAVAAAYHRGRPAYPEPAVRWLTGQGDQDGALDILELGAGTGKLTAQLVALGHRVHATDPDPGMLDVLSRELPDVPATLAGAERIPLEDASVDVVVAGQAFHWFDHRVALPEIARVLRPGGHIALVWNYRDERIPWVRKLGTLIGTQENQRDPTGPLLGSAMFGVVQDASYSFWQTVHRTSIVDLVASRSNVATLSAEKREAKLAEVLAFYDDYGRGMDGMQLPYDARCFRAQVLPRAVPLTPPDPVPPAASPTSSTSSATAPVVREPRNLDETQPLAGPTPAGIPFSGQWTGVDTELLLIDFS